MAVFRGRVDELTVLDEPAGAAAGTARADPGRGLPAQHRPAPGHAGWAAGRWITEYYPCERVEESAEGWLVSLRATDLAWARRLVLGLGPDVTVVAPAELAASVRDHAAAALEAYATPGLASPQR